MNDSLPDHDQGPEDDRAATAFRAAMADPNTQGLLDPDAAKRSANRRRTAGWLAGGLMLVLIAAGGIVGIPTLLRPDSQVAQPAGPSIARDGGGLPADPAPEGWRTEQYRGAVFQVPADWGYAYEPGSAWCAGDNPKPEHRQPYVALGEPDVIPMIGCPELPDSMITEHVAALSPADKKADGTQEIGNGFWEATRTVGAVKLRAVSRDRELAERIVNTGVPADKDALCAPDHPLGTSATTRPDPASDVTTYQGVGEIALCQYDIGQGRHGLRATTRLPADDARRLITAIAVAPANDSAPCQSNTESAEDTLDVAVVLRVATGNGIHEVILSQRGCPEGGDTVLGGFDDGTVVHATTEETCRAALRKPLQIQAGASAVVQRCVG